MGRYTSGGVRIHTTDLTPIGMSLGDPIDIGGITSLEIPTGIETRADDAGLIYDQTRSIVNVAPVPLFTSKSIRQVLSAIGVNGFCYGPTTVPGAQNVDGTHPGFRMFGRRLSDCQDPPSGNEDAQYTSNTGLLLLGTLSAPRGEDATLSVVAHTLAAGFDLDPLAIAFNGATPTTLVEEQFTVGHCMIAGVGLNEDFGGWVLEFGILTSDKLPSPGTVSPQTVGVRKVPPRLTLTSLNPSAEASLNGYGGKSCTHANTKLQLRKRVDRSKLVGVGVSEHILLTMEGILTTPTLFSGSGNADATSEYTIEGLDDGTNAPVTLNHSATYDSDLTT